jgi:tryptophan synthase alpha chain
MNRIDQTFVNLKRQGRKALIAYLAAGWPSLKEEENGIPALVRAGMDVLELGVPFSDPIADGPTIQWASQRALEEGVTLAKIFHLVRRLRKKTDIPILLMSYLNPILSRRPSRFFAEASKAGVDGLIIPDLIPEESGPLNLEARRWNLKTIHFVSPTSNLTRQRFVCRISEGFIYAVSVTGVTGARKHFPPETFALLKNLRRLTQKPVALGFGVSTPATIRELIPLTDGVIVGSALIDVLRRHGPSSRWKAAQRFLTSLRKALDH